MSFAHFLSVFTSKTKWQRGDKVWVHTQVRKREMEKEGEREREGEGEEEREPPSTVSLPQITTIVRTEPGHSQD